LEFGCIDGLFFTGEDSSDFIRRFARIRWPFKRSSSISACAVLIKSELVSAAPLRKRLTRRSACAMALVCLTAIGSSVQLELGLPL
jgi:hypothetical protein